MLGYSSVLSVVMFRCGFVISLILVLDMCILILVLVSVVFSVFMLEKFLLFIVVLCRLFSFCVSFVSVLGIEKVILVMLVRLCCI